jgi:hypothetical protein
MADVMIAWFAASVVFGLGWALSARMTQPIAHGRPVGLTLHKR